MLTDTRVTQEEPLLSYVIASSNMRYIEINEREIFLRRDPQLGLIIQGQVPHCGPDCNVNLSQILLEYAMSCEDCRDHTTTATHVDQFGDRLGQELVARLYDVKPATTDVQRLAEVMEIILNSLGVAFQKDLAADHLRYDFVNCPIHKAAKSSGLNLWVATAHRALVALCNHLVCELAPEWVLIQPSEPETDTPLDSILIVSK